MAISVGKLAPSAVVLAFMSYCAWPSVSDLMLSSQAQKPSGKIPELAASLFSPKLASCPTTNPFGGLDAASLAATLEKEAAAKAKAARSGSATEKRADNPYDPIGGLKLQATCIIGKQRMAVINGKTYAPQEMLPTGNSLTPTFKIIDVLPTVVLLDDHGRILELTYSNAIARHVSSSHAAKSDEPAAAAEKPPAKKPSNASTKVKADKNNLSSTAER